MQFRLRTMFIVVTLIAIICAIPNIWKRIQFQRFQAYINQDLQKLSETELEHFNALANSVLDRPADVYSYHRMFNPWAVWKHPSGSVVFLEVTQYAMIPGHERVVVTILSAEGAIRSRTEFSTGERIFINNSQLIKTNSSEDFLFLINSGPTYHGADITKQYFAIIKEKLFLVCLEDSQGKLVYGNGGIGPEFPNDFATEAMDMLQSQNRNAKLAAIYYFQKHKNPEANRLIELLTSDSDSWVAEAANLSVQQFSNNVSD